MELKIHIFDCEKKSLTELFSKKPLDAQDFAHEKMFPCKIEPAGDQHEGTG